MLITVFLIFGLFLLAMFMAIYEPHRGSLWFCVKDACTECLQTYYKSQVFCTNENDPNELVCKKCLRLVF